MSLINITDLTFSYDGSYDNIFQNANFQIDTDWKLGFTGRNGRGKTTFLNLLLGKYTYKGKISSSVCFEYFPFGVCDKTQFTIDVIRSHTPESEDWQILRELKLLDVSDDILYRPFETLSNGKCTKAIQERQMSAVDDKSKLLKNIEKGAGLKISPLKFHTLEIFI